MTQFKIPAQNVSRLMVHMGKFEKICSKLNLPMPTCDLVSVDIIEKYREISGDKYLVEIHTYEVSGVTPVLSGWVFKSKYEKMEDGDEIRSVPGFNLPEEFKGREVCDHCKAKRNRNRYFFVEKEETAELYQVGSSCIKDFLGHKNPEVVAAWFEMIHSFISFEEEEDYAPGSRPVFFYQFDEALAVTLNYIRQHGFLSRKKAEEQGIDLWLTTSSKVNDIISDSYKWKDPTPHYEPTEKDLADIAKMIQHYAVKEDFAGSDFITNIKNTLNAGVGIRPQKMGVMAAACAMWLKDTEPKEPYVPAVFYGQPKDKLKSHPVVFKRVHSFDGFYGPTFIYTFSDSKHEFVWKTGTKMAFEAGEAILLSGTVKEHTVWRSKAGHDHKQTLMTRCKIEEVEKEQNA